MTELEETLREHFGFAGFRPGQRELIQAVLDGRDALGVLPTGGGKSLAYQLPATLLPGLTVVVSPLIALMKDQVDAFNRRGRALAVALHSNLSGPEASAGLAEIHDGRAALLYVAPERLELPGYAARLQALKPKLFVIDEAHCVSHWGYDFRPSYLSLKAMVEILRPCPVLALTATATPVTRKQIVASLGLESPLQFVASFDRPNLCFEVQRCAAPEKPQRLLRLLQSMAGQGSSIVYVGRRNDADTITAHLRAAGLGAVAYHAGMRAQARKDAQEAWLSGERPIAVATVAFGMGIDKPDVRAVIHYQHPSSLEAYYQEAGRAGRDGAPARCITLFSGKDASLAHFFIRNRYPTRAQVEALLRSIAPEGVRPNRLRDAAGDMSDEQVNVALLALLEQRRIRRDEDGRLRRTDPQPAGALSLNMMFARKDADYRRLEEMLAYCRETGCHRARLLRYFGEHLAPGYRCGNCSSCSAGARAERSPSAKPAAARIARPRTTNGGATGPVFWKSKNRAFTFEELIRCEVPRRIGLSVLGLVAEAEGRLSPSGIANLLRGSRTCSDAQAHPDLVALKHFGAARDSYERLLPQVLAMQAKGYLCPTGVKSKKLALTAKGRATLKS